MTLWFGRFSLDSAGPYRRKTCQLSVTSVAPAGWSWRLRFLQIGGFVDFSPGTGGAVRVSTRFGGSYSGAGIATRFPADEKGWKGELLMEDSFPITTDWSPCYAERDLLMDISLHLNDGNQEPGGDESRGLLGVTKLEFGSGVEWRRC